MWNAVTTLKSTITAIVAGEIEGRFCDACSGESDCVCVLRLCRFSTLSFWYRIQIRHQVFDNEWRVTTGSGLLCIVSPVTLDVAQT